MVLQGLRAAVAAAGIAACLQLAAQALKGLHAEVLQLSSIEAVRHGRGLAASDASQHALALGPGEYRFLEQAATAEEALQRPRHAQTLWLDAVEQRPSWPYAWAGLARWELQQGGAASPALQLSLDRISQLGPHERGLQRAFAQQALAHWNEPLPDPVRNFLREALRGEYLERPHNVGGYAFVRHQDAVLCAVLGKEPGMGQLPGWCRVVAYVRSVCENGMPLTSAQNQWCSDQTALWTHMDYSAK